MGKPAAIALIILPWTSGYPNISTAQSFIIQWGTLKRWAGAEEWEEGKKQAGRMGLEMGTGWEGGNGNNDKGRRNSISMRKCMMSMVERGRGRLRWKERLPGGA